MIYILLLTTIIANAIMDSIYSNNSFAKYGLWFSRDGYKCKYILTEWLNKFLPLGLSKFLAQDILVIFTDLWHFAKFVMITCFFLAISFTLLSFVMSLVWGLVFSFVYSVIR
jgi:hypothetical protein